MTFDQYVYVVGDYFATGEGRTMMFMITRAYPRTDDYEVNPSLDTDGEGQWIYVPGVLKNTPEQIALREFREEFGDWFGRCGEVVTKEEFFENDQMIPPFVRKMVDSDDPPGNFKWVTQCHFNFS